MNAKSSNPVDVRADVGTHNITISTKGNVVTAQIAKEGFEMLRGKVFSLISIISAQVNELMTADPNSKGKMKFTLPDDLPEDTGIQLRIRVRDPKRNHEEPYEIMEKVWHPPYETK